jgi:hypothetical protein
VWDLLRKGKEKKKEKKNKKEEPNSFIFSLIPSEIAACCRVFFFCFIKQ